MLTISNLQVDYPGAARSAVHGASLTVAAGEILALVGPSGCGKSSLLRAVAGLETPTAGEISWDGHDVALIPTHERGFGLMFQEGQLFPHRTVGGNVAFGLQMASVPRPERKERVAQLLTLVGLEGYAGRRTATLSGGEQQRVALARSLAPRPKLLLLDEPLSALDRHLRDHLAGELSEILRATGTTAMYVTHDQDEAFTVADRVALMREGEIVQVGTPAEVWAAPVDAEAAEFLGYRIVDDGELALGPRALHVTGSAGGPGASGAPPSETPARHILERRIPEPADGRRTGTVQSVSVVRGEMVAEVEIEGWGTQPVISHRALHPGESVEIRIQPDQVARFHYTPQPPVVRA